MSNVLVIGAGKIILLVIMFKSNVFKNITLASRTLKKCQDIQTKVKEKYNININIAKLEGAT